jgi:uncharacterized protein YjiS (DUF1127 family)
MNAMTSITTNVSFNAPSLGGKLQSVAAWVKIALAAKNSRNALRNLDAAGLSQSQAQAEARRPLWDVPSSWTC